MTLVVGASRAVETGGGWISIPVDVIMLESGVGKERETLLTDAPKHEKRPRG